MEKILEIIKKYNTIIIHRHTKPDLDALGSQIGLKEALAESFPNKKIYIVGEENKFNFVGKMDIINDDVYNGALSIITDVVVKGLVSDDRYNLASQIIIFDHHTNLTDIDNAITYIDSKKSSACELIVEFIQKMNLKINKKGATALFGGIVTDTGRFFYPSISSNTFSAAAYLIDNGADFKFIYDNLYIEDLESKKMKSYFANKFLITEHNVAYLFNDIDVFDKFNCDTFTISRGMVGVMSGIEGINIWANFTYDKDTKKVLCEIRSRDCEVVQIAKKYGGGGHLQACGATLDNFDVAKEVLKDLDNLAKERFFND